jgi:predicted nucleic acid-binding protein
MAYLPDTNIVLRLVNKNDPLHQVVLQAIEKLEQSGEQIAIVPQVLVEFWTVASRPTNVNGLGMSTDVAVNELENLQKLFTLLPENEKIFDEWKILVGKYKVSGKTTHDARIVAAMIVHKIENILTLNPGDFKRFTEIKAVRPQDI